MKLLVFLALVSSHVLIDAKYVSSNVTKAAAELCTGDILSDAGTGTCGQVQNLRVEETDTELIVRWEPPLDPGGGIPFCGRFYFIEYEIDGEAGTPVRFHVNTNFTISKMSCAHHWFGIRSSLLTGAEGALAEIEHMSGTVDSCRGTCGQVQNLRIEETDTELIVRWEPALNPGGGIPICGRFYFIEYKINGEAGTPVRFHVNTNFTISKTSCTHHWFGIRSSLLTGGEGPLAEIEHMSGPVDTCNGTCGQVQNLRIEETDTELIVRWEPALDPGGGPPICGRFYFIEYEINGEAGAPVRFHVNTNFTISKTSCAHHRIGVSTSLPTGGEGPRADIEHKTGIIGDGAVEDLIVSNGYAVWSKPQHSESCTVSYQIDMEHQRGTSTDTTDGLTYPVPIIPCLINRITVTAYVMEGGRYGEPRSIVDNVPESSVAPIHGFTDPSPVGAAVRWVLSDEPNECEFVEILFELNGVGEQRETFNPATGEITAEITGFQPAYEVYYTARWALGSGLLGDISEEIFFQTVPLTNPTILTTEIRPDGGITITWDQDYNPFFVTGHIVEVTSLGPRHLLPSDCVTDTGETYIYNIDDRNVREYVFRDTRPHFTYAIKVITLFESLGMETTSDVIDVLTPTGTPGEVILQERHEYERGLPYDVKSFLTWDIPCDINGPLQEFTYKLSGTFISVSPTNSFDVDLESGTRVSDVSTTRFTIETQQLNPFFDNTLVINTYIVPSDGTDDPLRSTSESTLTINHLPRTYTPPIS